jgi:hypothetical protein
VDGGVKPFMTTTDPTIDAVRSTMPFILSSLAILAILRLKHGESRSGGSLRQNYVDDVGTATNSSKASNDVKKQNRDPAPQRDRLLLRKLLDYPSDFRL